MTSTNARRRNATAICLLLTLALAATVAAGCAPKVVTPPPPPPLDPAIVLREAVTDYFTDIPTHNHMISAADLWQLMQDTPDAVFLIDTRSKDDYDKGHVPGAVHIPWKELGDNLNRIPTNRQVFVVCYTGQTAGQSVAVLNIGGIAARSMSRGMNFGWTPGESVLTTAATPLPEARTVQLNERETILRNAAAKYFSEKIAANNNIIQPAALAEALGGNPDGYYVMDIRSKADYDEGHIAGAHHYVWREVGTKLDQLPKGRTIVVACYSGQTSGQTVAALRMLGYEAISLGLGMNFGWKPAELPLVK